MGDRKRITVGVQGEEYPLVRNVTGLPFEESIRFRTVYDVSRAAMFLQRRLLRRDGALEFFLSFHMDFGLTSVDLLHFFNTVSLTTIPWLVTFEHFVPRWNSQSRWGMRLLAQDSCRAIIALSDFALRCQRYLFKGFPDLREVVESKLTLLLPPQEAYVSRYDDKGVKGDEIVFAFVARDFFRKGGKEILRASRRLQQEGVAFHLIIVSSMQYGDYASRTTIEDVKESRKLIAELGHHVTLHDELSHADVVRMITSAHVGLLPTYDDTFGFSVLECQAAAAPMITTDVCALPEVNSPEFGWVIPVRKNELGQAVLTTDAERRALSAAIEGGLYSAMKSACEHPEVVRGKGEACLRRIVEQHSPAKSAAILADLYRSIASKRPRTWLRGGR